jgi:hypothetical protein
VESVAGHDLPAQGDQTQGFDRSLEFRAAIRGNGGQRQTQPCG